MATDVRRWLAATREQLDDDLVGGLQLGAYYLLVGLWLTLSTRVDVGTPAFERDWDLLVVLDACRTDALAAVADEYDFLADRETVWSPGSTSGEWVAHTFDRAYAPLIAGTGYVTANPHSDAVLRDRLLPPQYVAVPFTWPDWDPVGPDELGLLDEVWADARDDDLGVVPPATVTDRAIAAGRDADLDRLVVHYMQPHVPYVGDVLQGDAADGAHADAAEAPQGDDADAHADATGDADADAADAGPVVSETCADPFAALRRGDVDRETVWAHYLDNLRLVLDEVAVLLENVDAERVVVTADHGEAFGEWGFYEHPVCCPHPAVKRVPWVETTATDRGTRDSVPAPTGVVDGDTTERDVAGQLRDLGYH